MGRSAAYVRDMFTAIAPRYDFLNHLLSLNVDRSWRRTAVQRLGWETKAGGTDLDLCGGTLGRARAPGAPAVPARRRPAPGLGDEAGRHVPRSVRRHTRSRRRAGAPRRISR